MFLERLICMDEPIEKPTEVINLAIKAGKARMSNLSSQQRHELATKAAKRRWASSKSDNSASSSQTSPDVEVSEAASLPKNPRKPRDRRPALRRTSNNRVFSVALNAAEKRLAKAIEERATAANLWAVLNAEIPSLQQTIAALRKQQNPTAFQPSFSSPASASPVTLETLVGGSAEAVSPVTVSSSDSPAASIRTLRASRAQGTAVAVDLQNGDEDEDRFLRESPVANGQWH
jgi:hypothetical protein